MKTLNGATSAGPAPSKIRVSPAEAEDLKRQVADGTLSEDELRNVVVEDRRVEPPPARLKPPWDYRDGLVYVAFPSAKATYELAKGGQSSELSQGIEVLVSDGRILSLEEIDQLGFKVDENYHREYVNWSSGSLQQLIDKKANPVNIADLFLRIKVNLQFFVDLPPVAGHSPETTASLLSLWCLGTYFMPIWSAFGYVHFDAAFEDSGKSRAAGVLTDLAFWPVVLSGPSTIPEWRETPLISAALSSLMMSRLKTSPTTGRQMLYVGYKEAGAKVRLKTLTERSGWTGTEVDVFAPRVFASVAIMDPMLRSRTYRIEMARTANPDNRSS